MFSVKCLKNFFSVVTIGRSGASLIGIEYMNLEAFKTVFYLLKQAFFGLLCGCWAMTMIRRMWCRKFWLGLERPGADAYHWKHGGMVHADHQNLSLDKLRANLAKATESLEKSFHVLGQIKHLMLKTELGESMQHVSQLIVAALPEKQQQVIHLRDVGGTVITEICGLWKSTWIR